MKSVRARVCPLTRSRAVVLDRQLSAPVSGAVDTWRAGGRVVSRGVCAAVARGWEAVLPERLIGAGDLMEAIQSSTPSIEALGASAHHRIR